MSIVKPLPTDIRLYGEIILSKHFGVDNPSELTSAERHRAYVMLKQQIEPTARSIKDFEQKIQQITDYLQL